jgi:hypothetical protein
MDRSVGVSANFPGSRRRERGRSPSDLRTGAAAAARALRLVGRKLQRAPRRGVRIALPPRLGVRRSAMLTPLKLTLALERPKQHQGRTDVLRAVGSRIPAGGHYGQCVGQRLILLRRISPQPQPYAPGATVRVGPGRSRSLGLGNRPPGERFQERLACKAHVANGILVRRRGAEGLGRQGRGPRQPDRAPFFAQIASRIRTNAASRKR